MRRDVMKEVCERLFRHHRESAEVCRNLEKVDKACESHHLAKHSLNRDFYDNMSLAGKRERLMHFPKIIKDAFMLKKNKKLLEKRRHALKVYKALKEAGADFELDVRKW